MLVRARRRPGLTVAVLLSLAALVALGSWQLQRRAWKEAVIARVEAARTAPAQPIATLLPQGAAELDFRNATADCPGLATAPYVRLYAIVDGRPGWRLISACPLPGGRYDALLVDRGFAPDGAGVAPPVSASTEVVRVTGPLRAAEAAGRLTPGPREGLWFSRDVAGMAAALGVQRAAPVVLTATTPAPAGVGLTAAPLPGEIANRHLEYALTWFGLAAALVVFYVALLFRSPERR